MRLLQLSLRSYVLRGEARFSALRRWSLRACLSDQHASDGSSPTLLAGIRIGRPQPTACSLFVLLADRHSAQFPGDGQPLLRPGETLEDRRGLRRRRGLYAHRELDADRSAARVAIPLPAQGFAGRLHHYEHLSAFLTLRLVAGDSRSLCLF